ncbi:S-layer homology domain-containing protein [Anaerobacillus sp. HL2]|nr:S-layer homology domain-containing protein [Anaerobacillus sp. HL2]
MKQGVYYTDAAAATMQAGIFKGKSDGTFGALDELTREQMATLLVRVLNLKPNSSTPVTIGSLESSPIA